MEYVALYRKYRPNKLDEIYGQKYIVEIVKNSIKNNRFMHAYLFSGPRGTGKTTVAKMLAKIVNCINLNGFDPCDKCDSCKLINDRSNPDIIEIDAASNNGVDEIRTIRDSVVLMPSISKYKVYIIDEVHMLSSSAFNALLKTLEEPPEHVIFILATTESNKIPETITSRCQCYDFKRISNEDIVDCLKKIVKKEKIDIDEEVLSLIANYSNGGMRDSIGLLDKLLSYSNVINVDLFYDVVGLVDNEIIGNLFKNICNSDINKVFDSVEKLVNNGKNIELITEQLLTYLRNLSINNDLSISFENFMKIVNGVSNIYNGLKNSFNQMLFFEIEMLKVMNEIDNKDSKQLEEINLVGGFASKIKNVDEAVKGEKEEFQIKTNEEKNIEDEEDEENDEQIFEKEHNNNDIIINNAFALANKNLKQEILNKWSLFNDYVHNKEFSSLVSYFLDSTLEVVGKEDVIISTDYDTVVESANRKIAKLELLFNLVMGKSYNLAFVTTNKWDELKNKYVEDIKNGKKYEYIEEKNLNSKKDIIIDDATADLSDVVNAARDIFGKDVVEIK